jgi:hypothetical protein
VVWFPPHPYCNVELKKSGDKIAKHIGRAAACYSKLNVIQTFCIKKYEELPY